MAVKSTLHADVTGGVSKKGKLTPHGDHVYGKLLNSSDTSTMSLNDIPTGPIKGARRKNNVNPGYGKAGLDLDEPMYHGSRRTTREVLNDFSNVSRPGMGTAPTSNDMATGGLAQPSKRFNTQTFTGSGPVVPNAPGGKPAGRSHGKTNVKGEKAKRVLEGIDLIGLHEHAGNNEKVIKELVNK